MDVTVIICTWNRSKTLKNVLTSLEACVVPGGIEWEVLVVDNNSTDDTSAVCESFIKGHPERFRYLFEGRQGKTNALNAGILQARGSILALTDDDLTVDPQWVAAIYDAFQKYDCAAVGGKIIPVWNCTKPSWIAFDGPYRHPAYGGIVNFDKGELPVRLTATAIGANMALRKSTFEKLGPYRTDLNRINDLLGGEDTEYCRRIMRAGELLMYAPKVVVYHPVEEYRTKRKYMRSMAFHYGRWSILVDRVPDGAKCFWGVPRYLFPIALQFFAKWVFSRGGQRRSFYKLEFIQTLGKMAESKKWLRNRQPQQPAHGLHSMK
ncbi:MAG TPA: glycosyltransferase [Candidatus Acidoferrum sp.]|nr:glycosyltransferase [Candidatus Acidoferrum sp.]